MTQTKTSADRGSIPLESTTLNGDKMRYLLVAIILSCTEVSISKVPDKPEDSAIVKDSAGSPVETATDPPEGIGGYIHYYLRQVACPSCMGIQNEITVDFRAKFHEKTFDTYTRHIPVVGECTQNVTPIMPMTTPLDVGSQIIVQPQNGQPFFAARGQDGVYFQTWNTDVNYIRDTQHFIDKQDGANITSFFSLHGFTNIEPYELRYVDPAYAFSATIYKSGATFWWAPAGSNSIFNITLAVYKPDGSALLGYVSCSGTDSGMMTIPGQYLSNYPYNSLVAVHLIRHQVELIPWPEQNTFIESHMEWEVVGTGHLE